METRTIYTITEPGSLIKKAEVEVLREYIYRDYHLFLHHSYDNENTYTVSECTTGTSVAKREPSKDLALKKAATLIDANLERMPELLQRMYDIQNSIN